MKTPDTRRSLATDRSSATSGSADAPPGQHGPLRALHVLLLALVCLSFAAPADAASNRIGAVLTFPVPAAGIGSSQLGVDAGITYTCMDEPRSGVGVDLIYHHWPASAEFTGAFDRYLRSNRFEALDGDEWALSAIQLTVHGKLVASTRGPYRPWLELGAGAYRLDYHLVGHRTGDTYVWIIGPMMNDIRTVPGGFVSAGLDFHFGSSVVLGLDATLHYVFSRHQGPMEQNDLPDFRALTLGTHVLFGR